MKKKKQSLRKRPSAKKRPSVEWETKAGHPGLIVVGVDEVGRGCLAGPVVAGAVVLAADIDLKTNPWIKEINDSKLLNQETRERLALLIRSWAKAYAIGVVSVEEIDRLNIHYASHLAMQRAVEGLGLDPAHILVDGKFFPKNLRCSGDAVIKGDMKCLSIACGSILAKVWRDQYMAGLDQTYPGYGFAEHKGYGTPAHCDAIKRLGVTELHRRSFSPVAVALGKIKAPDAAEGADELSLFDTLVTADSVVGNSNTF